MQQHSKNQELYSILLNEKSTFEELLLLLKQERTALENKAIEELSNYSIKKQLITKNMEELASNRNNAMISSGFNISNSFELSETIKQLPDSVQALWQQILNLAEDCHANNQVNGKIIQISKSRVDRSLRLLKSQTGDTSLTYTAKGYANISTNRAKILEA